MAENRLAAECFAPGEFIRDEMDARGLTLADLALAIEGKSALALLNGERPLDAMDALRLGRLFGTGPQFWMNLEAAWQSWRGYQEKAWAHGWKASDG